ncbi:MAG: hypothetical protein M3Z26_05100 [Bacteroidota bacterium]|nr:hypothetical protein [Bacteroidota bacterium]
MQENKNYKKDELSDLIDSPKDREEMKQEITKIDMPDVNDIPGQEGFVPAPLGELGDTTISSADEEGDNIFDDDIDEDIEQSADFNVSQSEKDDLRIAANDMPGDDENLRAAALDNTDEDETPLNEGSFKKNLTASDLDIPGADLDDDDEKIGEEDEENNDYSLGADNDSIPEDDF